MRQKSFLNLYTAMKVKRTFILPDIQENGQKRVPPSFFAIKEFDNVLVTVFGSQIKGRLTVSIPRL